jgi:hypothetical protein
VARHFKPFLVNTVVGFIGPEYLYNGKQIIRAGLEDHFCGKLLGVPMGCDICYTNHAEADQDDMDTLLTLLGVAGINFIMGIPGSDDIMLNYQTTSFHDALYARQTLGLKPAPEFEQWLAKMGIFTQADGKVLWQQPAAGVSPGLGAIGMRSRPCNQSTRQPVAGTAPPDPGAHRPGRTGTSLPTSAQLDFQFAHAQARDAVHCPSTMPASAANWRTRARQPVAAQRRQRPHSYLQRPDLGRR